MRTTLFFLAVASSLFGLGQANTNVAWQERSSTLGGGLEIGIPLGEYDFTWGTTTFGLSANIAFPFRRLPLEIGYDFGWSRMGSEYGEPTNPGGLLTANNGREVSVKSNIYSHHALLRLNPLRGRIRPYGDVLVGGRQFSTRSVATASNGEKEEERDGAFTSSMGWAVGTMVSLSRQIYVEARVERFFSGMVSYVDPRTIEIANDGSVTYEKLTSRTDVINIQLGVGLRF